MSVLHAALLGVLQGLTEFLPVSSSGHLALAQLMIPGFSQPGVVFDAILLVGTAAAVVCFEWRRILEWAQGPTGLRLLLLVMVGTVATALVALPLRGLATAAFLDPLWVGVALLMTAGVVGLARWLPGGADDEHSTSWRQAVLVGLGQGLAVFPGLSRSGMTIVAGLGSGLARPWAAHFSFVLAVPAILAATTVEVAGAWHELGGLGSDLLVPALVGALCAAATGFIALRVVIGTLSSRIFHRFAWYCAPLGAAVIVWGLLA